MYFVTSSNATPIAHATLEAALKTLRSELRARESQGFTVAFNDKLEFELSRSNEAYRMWIEDENGQNVTSKDAAFGG